MVDQTFSLSYQTVPIEKTSKYLKKIKWGIK